MSKLRVVPFTIRKANEFIGKHHRHSRKVQGGKYAIAAIFEEDIVGVAIVGRPVARLMDDGFTAEVTRCCVLPTAPKGSPSFLYGKCWRIWQQMGGDRMITYTLKSESGASLRGAGWKITGRTQKRTNGIGTWGSKERTREYYPIYGQLKLRWEAG